MTISLFQMVQLGGFAISLLVFNSTTYAASFDCQKAKSINERLICEDAELSKLDDENVSAYKDALRKSSNPNELIANQRDAWKYRENKCSSKACLVDWYSQRQSYLNATSSQLVAKPAITPPSP